MSSAPEDLELPGPPRWLDAAASCLSPNIYPSEKPTSPNLERVADLEQLLSASGVWRVGFWRLGDGRASPGVRAPAEQLAVGINWRPNR
jgi:hypothetical protein